MRGGNLKLLSIAVILVLTGAISGCVTNTKVQEENAGEQTALPVKPLSPIPQEYGSEEEVLKKLLQEKEIEKLAGQKELLILISGESGVPRVGYYINVKDLHQPEGLLGTYTYSSAEGLRKADFVVMLPSAVYEAIGEEDAKSYGISLRSTHKIYVMCKISGDVYSVTGIGWNESEIIDGFLVSRAEVVRAVKSSSGWIVSRNRGWVVKKRVRL